MKFFFFSQRDSESKSQLLAQHTEEDFSDEDLGADIRNGRHYIPELWATPDVPDNFPEEENAQRGICGGLDDDGRSRRGELAICGGVPIRILPRDGMHYSNLLLYGDAFNRKQTA